MLTLLSMEKTIVECNPKELGGQGFVTTMDVAYVRRFSSETNKLGYVRGIVNKFPDCICKHNKT